MHYDIYYPIMNEKNFKTNSLFFSLLFNYQNLEYELINEQSGEGLCPYDPTHLSTATFFGEFIFYCIDIFVKINLLVIRLSINTATN
jgi:hypothetical protein